MTIDEIIKIALEAGLNQDGEMWFSNLYGTDMDVHIIHLERFAKLVEQQKCKELSDKIAQMPFGDTAASFSVWVKEQA